MKMRIVNLMGFLTMFITTFSQSFSHDKTSAINFIKRVYSSSPFEGVNKIEGEEANYYAVSVSYTNIHQDSVLNQLPAAQIKAQIIAEQGFAEPCVKFEMIEFIEKGQQLTFLFLCTTLEEFITGLVKKNQVDGAKIISAPGNKYIVATISLENSKYTSLEMRDKAAIMKAKQFVNTMLNGSTITSDQIIRTDESDTKTEIISTETVREQAVGFIKGLELLFSKEIIPNKTTYVYYSAL